MKRGKYHAIAGSGSVDDIFDAITAELDDLHLASRRQDSEPFSRRRLIPTDPTPASATRTESTGKRCVIISIDTAVFSDRPETCRQAQENTDLYLPLPQPKLLRQAEISTGANFTALRGNLAELTTPLCGGLMPVRGRLFSHAESAETDESHLVFLLRRSSLIVLRK